MQKKYERLFLLRFQKLSLMLLNAHRKKERNTLKKKKRKKSWFCFSSSILGLTLMLKLYSNTESSVQNLCCSISLNNLLACFIIWQENFIKQRKMLIHPKIRYNSTTKHNRTVEVDLHHLLVALDKCVQYLLKQY